MNNEKSFEEKINNEINYLEKSLEKDKYLNYYYELILYYKLFLNLWKKSNEECKFRIEYIFQFYYENNRIIEENYINENFSIIMR